MLNFKWFDNLIQYYNLSQKLLNNRNIFFVWWIIRDILLNIKTNNFEDIDITLAWNPSYIFDKIDKSYWSIFKTDKFWTITIVDKVKNCKFEITPFREEWTYSDSRHPDELKWTNNLINDSLRRDFTINSLYYSYIRSTWNNAICDISEEDISADKIKFLKLIKRKKYIIVDAKKPIVILFDKELILKIVKNWIIDRDYLFYLIWWKCSLHLLLDPNWWLEDIIKQKIKAVWDSDDRIQEDALRIIRWIRFVSTMNSHDLINFDFDTKTWISMKKYYFLLRNIAKERIIQEMKRVFSWWNAFWFIWLMDELNILWFLFPSLERCKCNNQTTRYHIFDTYTHSLLSLYHLQKFSNNYLVRFWMLYHDVGKPDQYYRTSIKKDEESQQELYKLPIMHPEIWSEYTKDDFSKLWFSKKEVEEISFYVKYHMYPWELLNMWDNKRKKEIKKFISNYWIDKLLNLCDITIWDRLWQYNPLQHSNIEWIYNLKEEIKQIYEISWRTTLKDLAVNWKDILKIVWKEWPLIWQILNKLLEFVLEDESKNNKAILLKEAKKIAKSINN